MKEQSKNYSFKLYPFLSDPSPIIVNLIDVTLAFEDANSKLVEAFIVADVDDEDRVMCRVDMEAEVWS